MFITPDFRRARRIPFNLICAVLICVAASQAAMADELAVWNFNDSNLNVDHGSGTLTTTINAANVSFAAGTTNNARQGDIAGQALSLQGGTGTANNGRNITFNVSTLGFSNILVSFATQGTSTGFNNNQFQYSLDGISFIDFGSPYVPATAFGAVPIVFSLAAIVGLNDNPNAAFRIVFNGASSSTGNNRIDNIVVEGTGIESETIPEPTSLLLLLSGLGGVYKIRRRKKANERAATEGRPYSCTSSGASNDGA
ncbi:MAG TPA: PEP-CTERM sorting domain-containing protein [Pyrinomonadaceae bacterium]|nr:PEP-CTERM sorting domain-containing protein [Pyrinomonadaceae bacterium]